MPTDRPIPREALLRLPEIASNSERSETTKPFTPAEAAFWAALNEYENLPAQPDEPEVGFTPLSSWRRSIWDAVQAIRTEDAIKRRRHMTETTGLAGVHDG